MSSLVFQFDRYLLKRQVFALTGKFRIYDPAENLVLFSEQKMFRLREDIRVYADEAKTQEVLMIKARQIIDFSAAYDVIDSLSGQKVGALRRKGWRSLLRDEWEILDANDQVIGMLFEDSMGRALLRRFLLGSFLPQNYDLTIGTDRVADLQAALQPLRLPPGYRFQHGCGTQAGPPAGGRGGHTAGRHRGQAVIGVAVETS